MDERKQFTFYASYLESLEDLPDKAQGAILLAVVRYALYGIEPELVGSSKTVFKFLKPKLDKTRRQSSAVTTKQLSSNSAVNSAVTGQLLGSYSAVTPELLGSEREKEKKGSSAPLSSPLSLSPDPYLLPPYNPPISSQEEKKREPAVNAPTRERFVPPTVEEVADYCRERGNGIDAQHFVDFYDSKGWMIGKNKMKDWKAAVRNWEQRRKAEANTAPVAQRQTTQDRLNASYNRFARWAEEGNDDS